MTASKPRSTVYPARAAGLRLVAASGERLFPDPSALLSLLLGLLALEGAPGDPVLAAGGTALCVAAGVIFTRLTANRGRLAAQEGLWPVAIAAAGRATLAPMLCWVAALMLFDWGGFVAAGVPRLAWLGRYVVLLLPAVVLLGAGWVARADVENAMLRMHGSLPTPTVWDALRAGLRRNGLAALPVFVLLGVTEGIWVGGTLGISQLETWAQWLDHMPLLEMGLFVVLVLLTLPFLPAWIARWLHAQALPAGHLRARLEAAARVVGLRAREILVWPTRGRALNAMIVGVTPSSRRIFLTDRLLAEMPPDELEAVFLHEAGHARRQHLVLFLLMFFALGMLMYASQDAFLAAGLSPLLLLMLHLGLIWFVLLGFVSRRFEREADLFGATHAGTAEGAPDLETAPGLVAALPTGAARMIRALDRLRRATQGLSPSHRHGTLEERMAYVAAHASDPEVRRSFRRQQRFLYGGIAVAILLAVLGVVQRLPLEIRRARASMAIEDGERLHEEALRLHDQGDGQAARPLYARALSRYRDVLASLHSSSLPADRLVWAHAGLAAADVALDGLDEAAEAQQLLEPVLPALQDLREKEATSRSVLDRLAFVASANLSRLAARRGQADAAADHADRAEHLATALSASPGRGTQEAAFFAEVLRFVRLVLQAHDALRAPPDVAAPVLKAIEKRLDELAALRGDGSQWRSLRIAARQERARLSSPQ